MHVLLPFGFLAMLALGVVQLVAGFTGIEHELGIYWAWGALFVALFFRFMLPMTIGAFFGATEVWGWHWAGALLLVAPGLLFIVPGLMAGLYESFTQKKGA